MQIIYPKNKETIEVSNSAAAQFEEENRNDVVQLVTEIAETIGGKKGRTVNYNTVKRLAVQWFEKHKNHDETFVDELLRFSSNLEKMFTAELEMEESNIWLYR